MLWIATFLALVTAAPTHLPRMSACAYNPEEPFAPWTCLECGHENHYDDDYCRVCEADNPDPLRVDPYTGMLIEDEYWD